MGAGFWIPFLLIFAAAILITVLQRRSRDVCLQHFEKCYVLVKLKNGKWIWGYLRVLAKSLVLDYPVPRAGAAGWSDSSYVLYEQQLADLFCILRPIPKKGTPRYAQWLGEIDGIRNPSPVGRTRRSFRNFFNTVRDAFSQTVGMLVGIISQRTQMAKIKADEQATKVGQTLLNIVPNSYEPVLEEYISREVRVKVLIDKGHNVEWNGLLQEYSDKFILIRDAETTEHPPLEAFRAQDRLDRFGVLLPRDLAFVRHLLLPPRSNQPSHDVPDPADASIQQITPEEHPAAALNHHSKSYEN